MSELDRQNAPKINSYKLALVIPYFGKFNNYFDLWLLSCKNNPDVDFLIFTDDKTPYDYPENVKVTYTSFQKIKERASRCFDFEISLESAYKLCDYKAIYGDMFAEELKGYDFWGYCDTDLIWGRIRYFWNDDVLSQYDKISDSGHFTLYKNNDEMRTAYKTLPNGDCYDYREVYRSPESFAYDEWGQNKGINRILKNNGKKILYKPILFSDIDSSSYGLYNTRASYDLKELRIEEQKKHRIIFAYQDGILMQYALNDENVLVAHEEAYVHLQKRPMMKLFDLCESESFVIYPPNKFLRYPKLIDAEYLRNIKENKIYWYWYRIRFNNLIRKLKARFKKK